MYPYAFTKWQAEELIMHWFKVYNLPAVSCRFFNAYGLRSRTTGAYGAVFGVFIAQKLANKPLTIVGNGNQTRDFTHVQDIARANLLAMQSQKVGKGEVINIGNSDSRSVNDIARMIGGPTINIDPVVEPKATLADNTKAKELLGWRPSIVIEEWVPKYKKDLGI